MEKILIIEDEKSLRETLAEMLEIQGYEVVTAENGEDGLKKIIDISPGVVLCDVNMPILDGFQVLELLQSVLEKVAIPPFIFLTAKTEIKSIRQGMNLGAEDYITKPFESKDVLDAIKMRVKKRGELKNSILAEERERISGELHDNIQSLIAAASMYVHAISENLKTTSEEKELLVNTSNILKDAMEETRFLSHDLAPKKKKGLMDFLNYYVELLEENGQFKVEVNSSIEQLHNKEKEIAICRIIQELFTNAMKYSQATRISISITECDQNIVVAYDDNGVGFDSKKIASGQGLNSLKKKILNFNGDLSVETSIGKGLFINFSIPI